MADNHSRSPHISEEHILVPLLINAPNIPVIKAAQKMSEAYKCTVTAVFAEPNNFNLYPAGFHKKIQEDIAFAEELGIKVSSIYGNNLRGQIAAFAKLDGATKLVIGSSHKHICMNMQYKNYIEDFEICIIPDGGKLCFSCVKASAFLKQDTVFTCSDFLKTAAVTLTASALSILSTLMGCYPIFIALIMLLAILYISYICSQLSYPIISIAVFITVFTLCISNQQYLNFMSEISLKASVILFGAFACTLLGLCCKYKSSIKQSTLSAYKTKLLLEANRKLQRCNTKEELFEETAFQISQLVNNSVFYYYIADDGGLKPFVSERLGDCSEYINPTEQTAAEYSYINNCCTGSTTDIKPDSSCIYMPISFYEKVCCVVAIAIHKQEHSQKNTGLQIVDRSLIRAILDECILAAEKMIISEKKKLAEIRVQQERLRSDLLRSVSHDLRTPLTTISGNADILKNRRDKLDEASVNRLCDDIYTESMWLIRLVENLLSITKIENGSMLLNKEPELIDDIISDALSHISRDSVKHNITINSPNKFYMVMVDAQLILQLLINLINNAIKYTPENSSITISYGRDGERLKVEVADDGGGISDKQKSKVFNMFFSTDKTIGSGRIGVGLGLPLCKAIAAAHGGVITIADNFPHGAIFSFTLPISSTINQNDIIPITD